MFGPVDIDKSDQERAEELQEVRDRRYESSSGETNPLADYWHHDPAIFAIMSHDGTKQEF